jgi:hypothetical protein
MGRLEALPPEDVDALARTVSVLERIGAAPDARLAP